MRNSKIKNGRPVLYLIDGSSFLYRAFYAIRALSNSKGEPTNAIYGFVTMMKKLVADHQPDSMAICFDRKEPTFRHERFDDYKAHRKPMPDDLVPQIEPIKEFCRLSKYALFEMAGYEADDLIGTLAKQGEKKGFDVFIVTSDKDAMQLVNDHIKIINPSKEDLVIDREAVKKKFEGHGPEKVVDIMALMGDSSDNIPGVPGIGPVAAIKLIHQFGSVEKLVQYAGQISSKSQQTLIKDNIKSLEMSKMLATIEVNVPVKVNWDELELQPPDDAKLLEFYKRYEFRGLTRELIPTGEAQSEKRCYATVAKEKDFKDFLVRLKKATAFSFDTETTSEDPMRAELVGFSFSWEPYCAFYIPVSSPKHKGPGLPLVDVLEQLRPVLEDSKIKKFGQNIKYDWIVLKRAGVEIQGVNFDTMIASYLVNPIKLNHNLDDISLELLGVKKITTQSLIGSGKSQISMAEVELEKISEYACEDADCVFRLESILEKRLKQDSLQELFEKVEMPLSGVLAKMEMNGVCLDTKLLGEFSKETQVELDALTGAIYEEAGEEFNINSTKQLAEILFTKMKIPPVKKTKTGFSTDVAVLEKLALNHELPKKLLEYREKSKLKSTYLDALPEMINPETKLIHTSYHQTVTATGRLSSSDPNLQNIPIKTEEGRKVRKAFVPRAKNRKLLSADYSQIELRILAHLTGDKNLTAAFNEDRDVHKFTATLLYGVKEKDVTREMRHMAKTINFSVIYGKTAFGLGQELGIPISEADTFIKNYFERYKAVKDYLEAQKETARKNGYLTTILGRRSYFPNINSKNMMERQFAERAAINAPIQGSAADLIKLAMIAIQERLEKEKRETLMIMQVHDELVFDMAPKEEEAVTKLVRSEMETAYNLKVPLKVDVFTGDSWYK